MIVPARQTLIGIDYSTRAEHYAYMRAGELIAVHELKYRTMRDIAMRLATRPDITLAKTLWGTSAPLDYFANEQPNWCAIEGYVAYYDREGKLAGVHWNIRRIYAASNPLILPPATWKKQIGLKGNAQKEDVKDHILNLYPALPANLPQDAYDAVGIAHAALRIVGKP